MTFQRLDQTERSPYTRGEYAGRFAWLLVQNTLFRFSPPRAFGWRRWLLRRFGAHLGRNAAVRRSARIMHPWLLELGDWSIIGERVDVYNLGQIVIGAHTVISQDAALCAGTHDHTHPALPLLRPPITIGSGVWIAAGAFIGPGVSVGDNSVVSARAVAMRDIPPNVIAAGNPCEVVGPRRMRAQDQPADYDGAGVVAATL